MIEFISMLFVSWFGRMARKSKPQATKDNRAQVELHIQRQKELGELMINDDDEPTGLDVLVTLAIVGFVLFGTFKGWW